MTEMLALYAWTIVAGCVAAPALALLGSQLATRDRAMQTLCVGQGAMVGVLLGLGVIHSIEREALEKLGPLLAAILASLATILITDSLVAKRTASRNTVFAFVFALLLAVGYLISSLFPALESHVAQVYFGDLATLTVLDSKITTVASLACLAGLLFNLRSISNESFESAVFGGLISPGNANHGTLIFKLITLLMLSLSVQFLGFAFTVAMLFLPTALMSYLSTKGLARHFALTSCLALVSTFVGFLLSLAYTRLPTVPTIVVVMFLAATALLGVEKTWLAFRRLRAGLAERAPSLISETAT